MPGNQRGDTSRCQNWHQARTPRRCIQTAACSIAPYEARDEDGDKDFDEAAFDEWCDYMEKHEDDPNAMTWEEWKSRNRGIEQERPMANGARRSNTYNSL